MKLSTPTRIILLIAAVVFLSWSVLLAHRKAQVARLKKEIREYERMVREKRAQEALQRQLQAPAAAQTLPNNGR